MSPRDRSPVRTSSPRQPSGKDPYNLTLLQLEQTTGSSGQRRTGPPTEPGFYQVFFSLFYHRWSFGSLPLSPLACLIWDTSFPAVSPTWLHRYYLNWTELDDAITEFNNEMSGFCHIGLVLFMVLWQSPDTPVMSGFHVSMRLRVCALSSAYLVSCWSVVLGSRHSCLEFQFRIGVRTLALRFLSLCECAVSRSLGTAHSCPRVFCCVARSSCLYQLRAFMLYLVLCGTQLVFFHWLCAFVLSCCHVLCEHVAYEFSH